MFVKRLFDDYSKFCAIPEWRPYKSIKKHPENAE